MNSYDFSAIKIAALKQREKKEKESAPICHAGKDGDCFSEGCPQIRDGEPEKTGRHCPYDNQEEED